MSGFWKTKGEATEYVVEENVSISMVERFDFKALGLPFEKLQKEGQGFRIPAGTIPPTKDGSLRVRAAMEGKERGFRIQVRKGKDGSYLIARGRDYQPLTADRNNQLDP